MNPLSEVLSLLPSLSKSDLDAVVATARSLRGSKSDSRPATKRAVAKKRQKGPAKPVSPFASSPEYQVFKRAESALHTLLKKEGVGLRQVEDRVRAGTVDDAGVVEKFYAARNDWFRCKVQLTQSIPSEKGNSLRQTEQKNPPTTVRGRTPGSTASTALPTTTVRAHGVGATSSL